MAALIERSQQGDGRIRQTRDERYYGWRFNDPRSVYRFVYAEAMDGLMLHKGAAAAWDLVSAANGYVDRRAPWVQAKARDDAALDETLAALARCLARLAVLVSPFVPLAAGKLWAALGLGELPAFGGWDHVRDPQLTGRTITRIPALFPKPPAGADATP